VTTKKDRQLFRGRKVHPQRKFWLRLCLWCSYYAIHHNRRGYSKLEEI